MMKGGIYMLISISVLMATALTIASGYSYLQAKIAPMLVGGVILFLALVELIKELRSVKAPTALHETTPQSEQEEDLPAYLREAVWMAGFFAMIYVTGFLVGTALFTAAYAKAHSARWSSSLLLGMGMAGACYLLFSYIAQNELYPGLIWQLFESGNE